ncbi:MAG: N-acetylmuramic acid 6-phosphate etherase [Clostridia bacterium]|nr:N-acetylmuramic acid 6-phosphate etherase [Clostridia bacterium]
MRDNYDSLKTEGRNPRTMDIDKLSSLEMVRLINQENRAVEDGIDEALPEIAAAIDMISEAIENGGHVIYVGCGTSGRLGIVDASECPPTFGVDYDLFRGVIAGGKEAVFRATENAEDSEEKGMVAIETDGAAAGDVVVGLSASGRAPFVIGALQKAKELGCKTIAVTCNPGSLMENHCDIAVSVYVGPEVISGSTRLKAGTAQKLILNMFSTCAMIKTGKVRSNLMVNVRPTNEKLVERATRIIMQLADVDREHAAELLAKYGDVPTALDAYASGK